MCAHVSEHVDALVLSVCACLRVCVPSYKRAYVCANVRT
jgi:hypothetical protein